MQQDNTAESAERTAADLRRISRVFQVDVWLVAGFGLLGSVCFAENEPTYSVDCEAEATSAEQCTVDEDTYIGWRTYNSSCSHCHGQDGLGGSFAPSLVAGNAATREYQRFKLVTEIGTEGPTGVMPPFQDNPNINDKIDALYKYLKARSDKLLPSGRPKR